MLVGALIAILMLWCWWSPAEAATITATSCNNTSTQPHVRTALASAVNGDTVIIPAGTCTWTLWIDSIGGQFGPPYDSSVYHKAIKIQGGGAALPFTTTPKTRTQAMSGECAAGQTTYTCIIDNIDRTVSRASSAENLIRWDMAQGPAGFTTELSNIAFLSNCPVDGLNKGMLRFRGDNSRFRLHHIALFPCATSGLYIDGNIQGVGDHNYFYHEESFSTYTFASSYNPGGTGTGTYGDQSYATPSSVGTANAWFWENNTYWSNAFTGSPYCCDGMWGSRVVYRYNTFHNAVIDWHGTESNGRPRGTFQFEVYNNTFDASPTGNWAALIGARSGTGIIANNTVNVPAGSISALFDMVDYRHDGSNSPTFGLCTGSNAWDENAGVGSNIGYHCLDQVGVGHGDLIINDSPVNSARGNVIAWVRQATEPVYYWGNTVTCPGCTAAGTTPNTPISHSGNIQLNRDYFLSARPGWTAYTYPHPLVSGGTPIDTTPPEAPTGVTIQ